MNTTFATAVSKAGENLNIHAAWWHWALLGTWFLFLILFDILVIHKQDHVPTLKEAVKQSAVWIGLGIALGVVVMLAYGGEAGSQYFSGYLIEKSLSIDNVFAWSVIMGYFKIPKKYQHRVLFWGIIGALAMRGIFVFAGIALINRFEPILLIFGLLLLYSGFKLLGSKDDDEFDPGKSKLFLAVKKVIPVSHKLDGHKLFTVENGKKVATMLFMALLVVEVTDAIFAVDSVPAILAVSRDPFIVLSSNAAAILGLRALYFVFEFIKDKFWLLNKALGILMFFVGLKMIVAPEHVFGIKWLAVHISTGVSLGIIGLILASGVFGSLIFPQKIQE
jgi:tellurite resistance protein TerC